MADDATFLRAALDACRRGIDAGQAPFGSALAVDGELVETAFNTGQQDSDPSAHAEINVLRAAGRRYGTRRLGEVGQVTLYSSCEPCPMCFSAIVFAGVRRVVWAASVDDARAAGMARLQISNEVMMQLTGETLNITGGLLRDEAVALFDRWQQRSA